MSFDREHDKIRLRQLATQNIFLGTSSWIFEEWRGTVYVERYQGIKKDYSATRFKAQALKEYAAIFPTACFDGAYWKFPDRVQLQKYVDDTPPGFRMALKCPAEITVYRFPNTQWSGKRKGQLNPDFLNAERFVADFYSPVVETLGDKLGPIIFEFSPFHFDKSYGVRNFTPLDFVKRLHRFLSEIPKDIPYAVEVRDAVFVSPEFTRYLDCLRYHGIAHCLNEQTWMPPIAHQVPIVDLVPTPHIVARTVTPSGVTHEEAAKDFVTFDSIRIVREDLRSALAKLIQKAIDEGRSLYFYADNKVEGFSPGTVSGILDRFDLMQGKLQTQRK